MLCTFLNLIEFETYGHGIPGFTVTFTEKFNASGKCLSLQLNTVNHRKAIEVIIIGISGFSLEEIYIQLQTSLSITSLTFLITLPNK